MSQARPRATQEAYDAEYRDFWEDVSGWEKKLDVQKEARRVLKGLTEKRRQQLAAFLSDSEFTFKGNQKQKPHKRLLRTLFTKGPAQMRKSKRKLHRITQDAENYRNYTRAMHPWLRSGRTQQAERILAATRGTLKNAALEPAQPDSQGALNGLAENPSFWEQVDLLAENPSESETVRLYCFFMYECNLPVGESEVCVSGPVCHQNLQSRSQAAPVKPRG